MFKLIIKGSILVNLCFLCFNINCLFIMSIVVIFIIKNGISKINKSNIVFIIEMSSLFFFEKVV